MSKNDDTLNDIKRQVDRIREQQITDNNKKNGRILLQDFLIPQGNRIINPNIIHQQMGRMQ